MEGIVSDDEVRSGTPRIDDTRITVLDVKRRVIDECDDPHVVAGEYDVPVADVFRALTYYYEERDVLREVENTHETARAAGERRTRDLLEGEEADAETGKQAD